jgi:putative DNA primase/helicase
MQFRQAMERDGLLCVDDICADGKIHRFTPPGDKAGSKGGWYKLHMDFPPSGAFGYWKSGLSSKWSLKTDRELTPEEKESFQKRMAADRARKHRERERARAVAKRKAGEIWSIANPDSSGHGYLERKKISPYGARVFKDQLVVPVTNSGELVGLQFIAVDGTKNFLTDSQTSGVFFRIGHKDASEVIICEGFATGASIHEATGFDVLVAFNAGNLLEVAKIARAVAPNAKIIVAADDDRWTEKPINNPGVHFAGLAASTVRGHAVRPFFKKGFDGKPTDFNDVAVLYGLPEVRQQILNKKPTFETGDESQSHAAAIIPDEALWDMLPDQKPGKKPISSIRNLSAIISRIDATVRYNVIKKSMEYMIPKVTTSLDNRQNALYACLEDVCNRFEMPKGDLKSFLNFLCDQNQFNPVMTWIESVPWDGKSRLEELYSTVKAKNENSDAIVMYMKKLLIRRWMISAVAAASMPSGFSTRGVLVFQGAQYVGKTRWFKSLVPAELDVIAEGKALNPNDKDSIKQVICFWMVELGEIDAIFRKSDISSLKAFISRDHDMIRLPYAAMESQFARRTVFFGSVNPENFLADDTGSSRYWTIAIDDVNHKHNVEMQQVWAEVNEIYKSGEQWWLTDEENEQLGELNKDFEVMDPIDERIRSRLNWENKDGEWKTATDILIDMGIDRPTKYEIGKAATVIKLLNNNRSRKSGSQRLLWIPKKEIKLSSLMQQLPINNA